MKFCNSCDNMLYIRLLNEDSNKLIYYCRNCGETYDEINEENICVVDSNINNKATSYLQDINEYTKLDPTLPRTQNIKCPNQSCISNLKDDDESKVNNQVIYLRYDDVNLNYIYICSHCDTIWKSNTN